ncbi:MAG: hypothetical protein K9J37_02655 [Saprospiraceae bacterium]|nr:hypothetical protein [Saprospiraceae bacterium]MCF8248781.1 hypothetical protein [Saprospiraceae bacterium]MCF8279928.1 hypothetical protein [Bacteroidales bacterium]MCF8310066.1 hypothetical protein [Saprospiraceae bacterium]MCF8438966.1 hypothetical protein [Saprospiraceae bacterium]
MKNKFLKSVVFAFTLAIAAPVVTYAQCPMCKIGAESNLKNGGTAGSGLNTGILYMLAMPYLLVSTLGFIWYKNRKKESELPDA